MIRQLCLCAAAALLLSGCGAEKDPPALSQQEDNRVKEPMTQTITPATAEELGRKTAIELTVTEENQVRSAPASLYSGSGFSLYVLEGWEQISEDPDNPVWLKDESYLEVLPVEGLSAGEAEAWFMEERGYVSEDLLAGTLRGSLMSSSHNITLSFLAAEGPGRTYLVAWQYPVDQHDGHRRELEAMVKSFQVVK